MIEKIEIRDMWQKNTTHRGFKFRIHFRDMYAKNHTYRESEDLIIQPSSCIPRTCPSRPPRPPGKVLPPNPGTPARARNTLPDPL